MGNDYERESLRQNQEVFRISKSVKRRVEEEDLQKPELLCAFNIDSEAISKRILKQPFVIAKQIFENHSFR